MFLEHKEEICRDLAQLQKNGVITETAFMMKLNPEGTPPVDAVTPCVRQFETMRDLLQTVGDRRGCASAVFHARPGRPLRTGTECRQYAGCGGVPSALRGMETAPLPGERKRTNRRRIGIPGHASFCTAFSRN